MLRTTLSKGDQMPTPPAVRARFGRVIHDVGGAGPIYAAVRAPGGRRYFSDELHHRVLVEEPSGYRWSFGTPGEGAGEFRRPRGLALVPGTTLEETRLFVCDAWNHRVQVFDGLGRPRFAFGGFGCGDGQFDTPSDIVVVCPLFEGEEIDPAAPDAGAWLAVADRSNNRVQVFGLDGVLVGVIDGQQRPTVVHPAAEMAGWPCFRPGIAPSMWFPVRLAWKAPSLEIVSANGAVTRVNLAVALLPDFETWRRAATRCNRAQARGTARGLVQFELAGRTCA